MSNAHAMAAFKKKTVSIFLNGTHAQRDRWTAAATRAGLLVSDWVRRTLDAAAEASAVAPAVYTPTTSTAKTYSATPNLDIAPPPRSLADRLHAGASRPSPLPTPAPAPAPAPAPEEEPMEVPEEAPEPGEPPQNEPLPEAPEDAPDETAAHSTNDPELARLQARRRELLSAASQQDAA
jgi:hypothetical protein